MTGEAVLGELSGIHPVAGTAFIVVWTALRWVVTIAFISLLFSVYYFYGPNRERPKWQWVSQSQREEHVNMVEHAPPWPKQGPASYFPSIEKKYGRSIADWQQVIADCGLEKHMAIVGYLKSEHGMGHGHANALVGWTLAGNVASP